MQAGLKDQPLPWHYQTWRALSSRVQRDNLPAALILAGAEGLGKGILAEFFAQALLCLDPKPDGAPCADCASCRQYAAGSHPDLFRLTPGQDKSAIVVDQVRAFSRRLFLTSHHDGPRVGLVAPSGAMTVSAANSFLKTLEEPPPDVHIILVTRRLYALPATIRSRCQIMQLPRPSRQTGLEWLRKQVADFAPVLLEQAGGAPLKALDLQEKNHLENLKQWANGMSALLNGRASPVALASTWQKETFPEQLDWLMTWLMDAYKVKLGARADLANADYRTVLEKTVPHLSWVRLRRLYAETLRARSLIDTQVNQRLLLESLLISWSGKTTRE